MDYAEIHRPTDGIQIIDDITNQFGVDTLEGRIGPLMQGVASQAHYIEMPPDLYVHEHPHSTESIIFTVRGQWIAVTDGKRHLMKPGSLFWFGPDIAAGYEIPFADPAFILIFKGSLLDTPEGFVSYLQDKLQPSLIEENKNGEPFRLSELPEDHPARIFARSVNQ
jgi:quercetin dioxygenase-like cupin family protein